MEETKINLTFNYFWEVTMSRCSRKHSGGKWVEIKTLSKHVSYSAVLVFCWTHSIQKLFMKYFTDGCTLYPKCELLSQGPHIWISLQLKTENSSCIFKQLLSVADLKWVMITEDIYINTICKWNLFLYFWQATALWWKHFRMFGCLIFFITITVETYCLVAFTGIGKPKPG